MTEDQAKQEEVPWKRAEIAAAIVHLYYMGGGEYGAERIPRNELAKLLGVERTTVWRALGEARESLALAEELHRRLQPYFEQRRKQQLENARRKKERIKRSNQLAKERRQAAKREKERRNGQHSHREGAAQPEH